MKVDTFVYRRGRRHPVKVPLDSTTAAITAGMAITASGATAGYFKEVDAAAEAVFGIAMQDVASPSADGDATVLVDISEDSEYEVVPDAGSVTVALVGKTMDVGADAKSVDIDASTTDDIQVVGVDTTDNTLFICLKRVLAGVI